MSLSGADIVVLCADSTVERTEVARNGKSKVVMIVLRMEIEIGEHKECYIRAFDINPL